MERFFKFPFQIVLCTYIAIYFFVVVNSILGNFTKFFSPSNSLMYSFNFSIHKIMSSVNMTGLPSFLPPSLPPSLFPFSLSFLLSFSLGSYGSLFFFFFSCLVVLARTYRTML